MVNRRFARALLIFTALLLPLQALAAVAMSLERRDATPQAVVMADGEHEHCANHHAPAKSAAAQDECNNCGICHLACSGYMPAAEVTAGMVPAGSIYSDGASTPQRSHITEPPHYPPRRSA